MKFGFRKPSLKGRISARTSPKRFLRHNVGLKAPRGFGWFTNPKKAAYNRVYNRTTLGCSSISIPVIFLGIAFLVTTGALGTFIYRNTFPVVRDKNPSRFVEQKPRQIDPRRQPAEKAALSEQTVPTPIPVPRYPSNSTDMYARPNAPLPNINVPYTYYWTPSYESDRRSSYRPPDGAPKTVSVRGYYRKNGTYVAPYTRRAPRSRY